MLLPLQGSLLFLIFLPDNISEQFMECDFPWAVAVTVVLPPATFTFKK